MLRNDCHLTPLLPYAWYQEHGRKGRKDKDDREGGTKSRKERGSSARKSKAAHGAPSPPPSITPAEEDKRLALQLIISRAIMFDIKFQIF